MWFVASFVGRGRHRIRRTAFASIGVVFLLLTTAAIVNARYVYKPYLKSLWGDIGVDVVLEDALKPTAGCTQIPEQGELVQVQLPGPKSATPTKDGYVYLPPAWCVNDKTQYPVFVYLHGTPSPDGAKDFAGAMELPKTFDAFAAQNGGKAPVVVFPNAGAPNDTECADSGAYGNIETFLSQDVPDWITSWDQFRGRIMPPGKGWVVGGYSMGGTCGIMLTLRHPDVWNTFADYGGDSFGVGDGVAPDVQRTETISGLFGGNASAFDERDPTKNMQGKKLPNLGGWFGVGGIDQGTARDMRTYYNEATQAGMTVCYDVIPGQDHTFLAWKPTFINSLPWLAARTGFIPMTPDIQKSCGKP
ncbi:MAG: hypothetical protein HYX32_15020 [Actinobacteria bacterium]|nr:hypothetical protein [Actinomycetota bacterium]